MTDPSRDRPLTHLQRSWGAALAALLLGPFLTLLGCAGVLDLKNTEDPPDAADAAHGPGADASDASARPEAGDGGDAGPESSTEPEATCHTPLLVPEQSPGVQCAYGGGPPTACAPTEHCCQTSMGASSCIPADTTCPPDATNWQCGGPLNCATGDAGRLCCAAGVGSSPMTCDGGPIYGEITSSTGSTCAASCAAIQASVVCSQSSDCAKSQCIPVEANGHAIGVCL